MSGSNVVAWDDPTANMYGCQKCPKCGEHKRYSLQGTPTSNRTIVCDDCGYRELAAGDEEC